MFKKLKDKLTEEVKIPSQKFTQSMQQLAQAVVSPGSSSNSTVDTVSNDNFSIDGEFDDTPQGSPVKAVSSEGGIAYRGGQATPLRNSFETGSGSGFMHVDLQQDTSTPKMPASLRSSVSSLASDSSFMFPVLESSGPAYNFQSDLESCSEASESIGPNINKEQLVVAYQKIQQKYHKYKGRYADLARHYRDLERDNKNTKHILTEGQDKALRRMAELKEQCNLEKQAKAHLEEALRSDLEEKDHLIHTLKTKIKLLRNQVDQIQAVQVDEKPPDSSEASGEGPVKSKVQEDLLTGVDSGPGPTPAEAVLTPEPANVESENVTKEKLKKLESLLHKCKEDITKKRESIKQLESDKNTANAKIESLQQQLITIQKREEEASLSLAKNKQTIHRELESKEDEIKKLKAQLVATNSRVSELETETGRVKEESKKAMKLVKSEMDELRAQKKTLEDHLASRESDYKAQEERAAELLKRLEQQEAELHPLKKAKETLEEKYSKETKVLNEKILKLQSSLEAESEKENKIRNLKGVLEAVKELNALHKQMRCDVKQSQMDNVELISKQGKLIQEKIKIAFMDLTQEHQSVLLELDEYKRESVNARESLSSVGDKFALLQQTLSTEKSEIESRIAVLKKDLETSEQQIAALEQNLDLERSKRQSIEEESSKKLALLQKDLDEEKSKNKEFLEGSSSTEIKLKSIVDELRDQIKELEKEKANITESFETMKEQYNILEATTNQLQQELEFLKTRDRESMNAITSMQMLLNDKNTYLEKLESDLFELKSEMKSTIDLQEKWSTREAELVTQISEITNKYQEASTHIKDLEENESVRLSNTDAKIISMQEANEEKEKEIVDLKNNLQSCKAEGEKTVARCTELQNEIDDLSRKCQSQESLLSTLTESNEKLLQSIQQLQLNYEEKALRVKDLETSNLELERVVSEKSTQSSNLSKVEEDLHMKIKECATLSEKLEEANISCSKLKELLESRANECTSLSQEVGTVNQALSEKIKILQEKSTECLKLSAEVENLKAEKCHLNSVLEEKIAEYEKVESKLSSFEREQTEGNEEIAMKNKECDKLRGVVGDLESEKLEIIKTLQERSTEVERLTRELESVKVNYSDESKILEEKVSELTLKLDTLTAENLKTVQLLKQRTIECDEKEAQLDNLADEMKRVEELSQELHRINDDRDANVEVLSSEASSLAQKVEELTATTQELKEREVDLLTKLQVAQDLEAEYLSMKQREEMLLSKLNDIKSLEQEIKANEADLSVKSKQIEELQEENRKLKEAGQNLNEIIDRAKETEARCEKLQNDGAGLLLRIQRAEESEIRCSLLEEELDAIKKEKVALSEEVELLQSKTVFRGNTADERSTIDIKEPVIEEPCIIKRYADLTESVEGSDGEGWKEKYNKLFEQHQMTLQENAAITERLKEEGLMGGMANNSKRKERIWDQHNLQGSLPDGSSNGSFIAVEKLQQQLTNVTSQLKESKRLHRQEVDDLRRILLNHGSSNSHTSSKSDNLEDATELEYLRNILFEYMMGKEPMILARVIAAVVKFDSEQTSKVLQKEQQRLSLLGHLGMS